MQTSKPLKDLIPDILRHYNRHVDNLEFDRRLYELNEGQIRKAVEKSLANEIISKAAYRRAIERIPSINIINKIMAKLSKVYHDSPLRLTKAAADKELMDDLSLITYLDSTMMVANHITNLHKRCAVEIYLEEGQQRTRVLAGHQFLPFSDSVINPLEPTVMIKLLGKARETLTQFSNREGRAFTNDDQIRFVNILALYSEDEFLIIDTDGFIREDKMLEMGFKTTKNPFGVIPMIYINTSKFELIPFPNQTAFDMGILIPKLLTDLNYAAQFQSHSVIWTRNSDIEGAEINPDAIVDLGDQEPGGGEPDIGTIDPKSDVDGVLKLIEFELQAYMSSVGAKSSISNLAQGNEAAGISKIIDESDTTEARRSQTELFRIAEHDLWFKLSTMQDLWASTGEALESRKFTSEFLKTFAIKYAEIKPVESEKQKYDKIKVARDLKMMTKEQALREIFPNETTEQIQTRLKEIKEELEEDKKAMLRMGMTPGDMVQSVSQRMNETSEVVKENIDGAPIEPDT